MRIDIGVFTPVVTIEDVGDFDLIPDGSFVVPDGVQALGWYTFCNCRYVKSITIPDTVTSIGLGAFAGCTQLEFINLPEGLRDLCWGAFFNCTNWHNLLKIPSTITYFGHGAFHSVSTKSTTKNYKAFTITKTGKYKCLDKEYQIGKKAFVKGDLAMCQNGLHFCTDLFELFDYYDGTYGKDFVVAEIETFGEVLTSNSSKCCARGVIPKRILSREEVIKLLNREEIDA